MYRSIIDTGWVYVIENNNAPGHYLGAIFDGESDYSIICFLTADAAQDCGVRDAGGTCSVRRIETDLLIRIADELNKGLALRTEDPEGWEFVTVEERAHG